MMKSRNLIAMGMAALAGALLSFPLSTDDANAGGISKKKISGNYRMRDIMSYHTNASNNNPSNRYSDPGFISSGGAEAQVEMMKGFYRQGYRMFYINQPFGGDTCVNNGVSAMCFTFFGALDTDKNSVWQRNFVKSWKRFNSMNGVYSMVYFGNAAYDDHIHPPFPKTYIEYAGPYNTPQNRSPNASMARKMLITALKPIQDAGFHALAIDASSNLKKDTVFAKFLIELQNKKDNDEPGGMDIFIEATPNRGRDYDWLKRFGCIRTTEYARVDAGYTGIIQPSECKGGSIVIYNGPHQFPEHDGTATEVWAPQWINRVVAVGQRPAIAPHGIDRTTLGAAQ